MTIVFIEISKKRQILHFSTHNFSRILTWKEMSWFIGKSVISPETISCGQGISRHWWGTDQGR